MKKVFYGFIVFVAASTAAFVLLKKTAVHRSRAADLVPADTIFFAQFPDLPRTAERWPQTAFARIWAEPEVQAFLAKPREKAPEMKAWEQRFELLRQIAPSEAFFAVTSIDGPQPKMAAGFSFYGRKSNVARLLKEPHDALKQAFPDGKSDLSEYGGAEIETFTYQDTVVAEAFKKDWYFVSNDVSVLRATLDAADRDSNPNSLGAQEIFKKATASLPAAGDSLLFAQAGVLSERLVSLLAASGQPPDAKQVAELKKIQAVAWGTKIDGGQWRDTVFVLEPGETAGAPMPLDATAFTGPQTILYYATNLPAKVELPQSSLALTAFLPGLQATDGALAAKGLKWGDFGKAFGPEFGAVVDWAPESLQPASLFAMDVRDPSMAKGFADAFTGGLAGAAPWGRKEEDGMVLYQSPGSGGLFSIAPAAALTDHFLVIGFSLESVKLGLKHLRKGNAGIASNAGYQAATKLVAAPSESFGYLDLKALFERAYGSLRPFIAMSIAFNPETGRYVDASKLPGTEAIAKHLGPSVFSQSTTADGMLAESVGPLTFNQVLAGGIGGGLAAALPAIENALSGGLKLDPSLLQVKPPGSTPAPSAAPSPAARAAPAAPSIPSTPMAPARPGAHPAPSIPGATPN